MLLHQSACSTTLITAMWLLTTMMSCCCLASPAPRSYSRRQQQADLEPQQLQQHLLFKRAPGAAVNINIVQRFFDVLNPQLHGLLKTNLDNFQLENTGFDIPVPLVGDIHFEATNMKVVNASVIAPSVITIKDGGVNVKFDDIAFKLIGDYTVTWGSSKTVGTITVDAGTSITGDLVIKLGNNGARSTLENLQTPFPIFSVLVSNSTALSWLVRVTNWIFGGTIRRVLGLVLTTSAKQLLVPVINMIIANQISIGIGTQVGTSVLSTHLVEEPRITAAEGIHLAIGLDVRDAPAISN